jgi:DNA invertase Pin-like site-specific DNA recombinase
MRTPEITPGLVPAAQYVRMSTEHQQYSTENQSDVILRYAKAHNMEIVRTYSDAGKSGLSLSGRGGLRELLKDVESVSAGAILDHVTPRKRRDAAEENQTAGF